MFHSARPWSSQFWPVYGPIANNSETIPYLLLSIVFFVECCPMSWVEGTCFGGLSPVILALGPAMKSGRFGFPG